MWRFLLLKFLPRRLLPLLVLYELYQLFRRFRRGDDDDRIIEGRATVVPPRAIDRGPTTAP
jgi:hypothetical protein